MERVKFYKNHVVRSITKEGIQSVIDYISRPHSRFYLQATAIGEVDGYHTMHHKVISKTTGKFVTFISKVSGQDYFCYLQLSLNKSGTHSYVFEIDIDTYNKCITILEDPKNYDLKELFNEFRRK